MGSLLVSLHLLVGVEVVVKLRHLGEEADHAGDAVLVSCVGIRIFDGTDFYVCIFILYVGDQKEWFPDRILHSYCGGNGDQCCHRSIYPGTGYYPVCR